VPVSSDKTVKSDKTVTMDGKTRFIAGHDSNTTAFIDRGCATTEEEMHGMTGLMPTGWLAPYFLQSAESSSGRIIKEQPQPRLLRRDVQVERDWS
jgi:hypothetical protein